MFEAGIRGNILRIIIDIYTDTFGSVKLGNWNSQKFKIDSGVMQGSKLGPILFNIFVNDLIRLLNKRNVGGVKLCCGGNLHGILYADDFTIMAHSYDEFLEMLRICEDWAKTNGMKFNTTKSKIMIFFGNKINIVK